MGRLRRRWPNFQETRARKPLRKAGSTQRTLEEHSNKRRGDEAMTKIRSGGGILGNKVRSSQSAWKVEPQAKAVNPAAAANLGMAVQFKKPNLEAGPGNTTKPMAATGTANARQGHPGVGPGGGDRTIYKSGSQSPTPAAREMPKGRDTL
jgi:hypothetical protein